MTQAITRTISFLAPLPPRSLHPNGRPGNRQQHSRETGEYRLTVRMLALAAMGRERPRFERAWLDLEYVFSTRRSRDDDGLAAWFKAGRDGLVDAGLVAGDDMEHLTIRRLDWRCSKTDRPGVRVTVEEVTG